VTNLNYKVISFTDDYTRSYFGKQRWNLAYIIVYIPKESLPGDTCPASVTNKKMYNSLK
jgi:hypothetical protein